MRVLLLIVLCLWIVSSSYSQKGDSLKIVETTEKYIQAFYQSKPEWLAEVLHPELVKSTIKSFPKSEKFIVKSGKSEMIELAKIFNQKGVYSKSSQVNIEVLDIFKNMASVKLIAENWIDYLHLAKLNGKWQIVQVLWLMK